jgi:hypothetical protein
MATRKKKRKKAKPKIQFSKEICVRSWWLMAATVAVCLSGEFALQWTGKGSMREVVTIVLSLISFVVTFVQGGYITQNIFRDVSLNKNGIHLPEAGDKHYIEPAGVQPEDPCGNNLTDGGI